MTILMLAQTAGETASSDVFFLWGCILFAIAVVLLVIEFFVPSGGLLGILCGIAAIASIVSFFKYDSTWGIGVALGYIILTPIAIVFGFRLWVNSPIGKTMILGAGDGSEGSEPEDAGMASERARQARLATLRELIGARGETETALRPVGTVRIDGQRIDGMAESGVIEPDTPIIVTEVYDNQVKVRPVEPGE